MAKYKRRKAPNKTITKMDRMIERVVAMQTAVIVLGQIPMLWKLSYAELKQTLSLMTLREWGALFKYEEFAPYYWALQITMEGQPEETKQERMRQLWGWYCSMQLCWKEAETASRKSA
jgi:hypothetical protein